MSGPAAILDIQDLHVSYAAPGGNLRVLRGVNLAIAPGETVGLVGESGSGKSTLAFAVMRYLAGNARIERGRVDFEGEDLLALPENRLQRLRGRRIGMVYQDPNTALNPSLKIGEQVAEAPCHHDGLSPTAAWDKAAGLLDMVRLPDPSFMMGKFPHEISGGEKQRALIAMAFACRPSLLVFDEPTTALDATTAAGILDLIRGLQAETGTAVLYITHDLGIVARIARRVSVIYAGEIVEAGPADAVLTRPRHPYTRALMASVPNPFRAGERRRLKSFAGLAPDLRAPPPGCIFQSRCPFVEEACRTGIMRLSGPDTHRDSCRRTEARVLPLPRAGPRRPDTRRPAEGKVVLDIRDLKVRYRRSFLLHRLLGRPPEIVHAVNGVSFVVRAGETLGLVGESGCGKSTLARALVGLERADGSLRLDGRAVPLGPRMDRAYRAQVQIVFQNPDLSLNPRQSVGEIVGRPLRLLRPGEAVERRVAELLERVNLPQGYARRYPHQLSGGEKQRVALARAFSPFPRVVICDEITSGLDVSVQAAIVNLLAELQDEFGTAYLFISHDLNVVRHIADRVAVMYLGRFVEEGDGERLFAPPYHPYTEALLSAVPVPEPTLSARQVRLEGPLPSPKNPPPGCPLNTRCPRKLGARCDTEEPTLREVGPGHRLACHIDLKALKAVPPIWQEAREGETSSA
ncbi:MAG: dipeptide ABC transporter ATP-binding protein [Pseudomonadota bacterium]